jgi:hypothetical protein
MLKQLERKLRPFAIQNITLYFIVCQVLVYGVVYLQPESLRNIVLIPSLVLEGEVWRLFTFLAVPPSSNPLFAFFFWYIWYLMGTALEASWGALRYNLFLLIGFIATAAAAFLTPDIPASNRFLEASVFLAFATLFPDFTLNLFFILPVKIKWLALIAWIGLGYEFVVGPWRAAIFASVLNYLLFFGPEIVRRLRGKRRRLAYQAHEAARKNKPFHVCRVCGKTDRSDPDMEFRYCSQCAGVCGYCSEHIRNHEHVTTDTGSMKA